MRSAPDVPRNHGTLPDDDAIVETIESNAPNNAPNPESFRRAVRGGK